MTTTQKFRGVLLVLCATVIATVLTAPTIAQMSNQLAAQLSENADQPVIVILKSQHPVAAKGSSEELQRASTIEAEQAPLMDELHRVNATKIKNYKLVNALAATVSKSEVERLKANPAVAEVVPDVIMRRPNAPAPRRPANSNSAQATKAERAVTPNIATLTPNNIPGACSATTPQLVPEGLALTNTDSDVAECAHRAFARHHGRGSDGCLDRRRS